MKSWLLKRLREPSTWAGIVTLITGITGFNLDEEQRAAIVQLGMAIAGVLFVFTREQTKTGEQVAEIAEQLVKPQPTPVATKAAVQPAAKPSEPVKPVVLPQPPTRGLQGRVNRNKR